jgi:hypothetical protein
MRRVLVIAIDEVLGINKYGWSFWRISPNMTDGFGSFSILFSIIIFVLSVAHPEILS